MALTRVSASGATSKGATSRLTAKLDRAQTEIALPRGELAIKDARWGRVPKRGRLGVIRPIPAGFAPRCPC